VQFGAPAPVVAVVPAGTAVRGGLAATPQAQIGEGAAGALKRTLAETSAARRAVDRGVMHPEGVAQQ
jgi:hypothetical protein